MNKIRKKINIFNKKMLRRFKLWQHRLWIDYISLKIENRSVKLIINERFEKPIKSISRVILFLNVILVFVFVPLPFNIIISLSLIAIEQVIERVIFSFISAYVIPPTPSFELWREAQFDAIVTGGHRYRKEPGLIGMYFRNKEAAKEVFDIVYKWNGKRDIDLGPEPGIRITFVLNRKKNKYAVFVSPSIPQKKFEELRLTQMEKIKQGKEPWIFIQAMIMCKLFNFKKSGFEVFLELYRPGYEYDFVFFSGNPSDPRIVEGTSRVRMDRLNIIEIEDLTQKDIEQFICKYDIDWDDDEKMPASIFWYE